MRNKFVLTNPPYLARNKNSNKDLYDKYDYFSLELLQFMTIPLTGSPIQFSKPFHNDNAAKFGQHESLKTFLLQTGDRILVEASPFDHIWGIGMAASHPDAEKPENWRGLNLLGFALMEVRSRLQASTK
jgi:hypothetical protein